MTNKIIKQQLRYLQLSVLELSRAQRNSCRSLLHTQTHTHGATPGAFHAHCTPTLPLIQLAACLCASASDATPGAIIRDALMLFLLLIMMTVREVPPLGHSSALR